MYRSYTTKLPSSLKMAAINIWGAPYVGGHSIIKNFWIENGSVSPRFSLGSSCLELTHHRYPQHSNEVYHRWFIQSALWLGHLCLQRIKIISFGGHLTFLIQSWFLDFNKFDHTTSHRQGRSSRKVCVSNVPESNLTGIKIAINYQKRL